MKALIVGLATAGLACGFLISASTTPVLAAAFPIIGGVLTAGAAFYQNKSTNDSLAALKGLQERAQVELGKEVLANGKIDARTTGIGMTVFFLFLLGGIAMGASMRNGQWFRPAEQEFYPVWSNMTRHPATQEEALEDMRLFQLLRSGGMKHEDAIDLLNLDKEKEPTALKLLWKNNVEGAQTLTGSLELLELQKRLQKEGLSDAEIERILALPRGSGEIVAPVPPKEKEPAGTEVKVPVKQPSIENWVPPIPSIIKSDP